jgi:hypothetical protein
MTFVSPLFFVAALVAAGVTVALHFIVVRQLPRQILPTARFAPERDASAPTMARRPADVVLLLLRVCLVLLIGAAFARPVLRPSRVPVYRIVEVDSGSISASLVAGLRAAARMRDRADSFELSIVSPFTRSAFDAATDSIRALWPGAISLVPAPPRGTPTAQPALVHWPSDGRAPGTVMRAAPDTVGALIAGDIVVVAPFERRWRLDSVPATDRVIARWVDGEPAAIAHGCERDVAVAIPTAGDIVLRPEYQRFADAMRAPCDSDGGGPAAASDVDALRGHGPARVPARALLSAVAAPVPLLPWLLGAALAVALAELLVRRRRT